MFRRFVLTLGLVALFLAACQPTVTSVPTSSPVAQIASTDIPTATPIPHGDAIRFALIGDVDLTNVWAYYDEAGAAYNNRAIQDGSWPSLYRLSPSGGTFEPFLAEGTFTHLEPDSSFLASNVTLRPGLTWSDGSPLTAADVAFTANTALDFRLGLDWAAYYDPDVLYRAEAVDAYTVRFYFWSQPFIEDWQYGALQGPIVHSAYWGPKVEQARAQLLPNPNLDQAISQLQSESARKQLEMDELLYQLSLLDTSGSAYQDIQTRIYKKQDEINAIAKQIEDKQDELESVFAAARQTLFALDSSDEPTFGPFVPSRRTRDEFENAVNPLFPFSAPYFDRAVYHIYPDEQAALKALAKGDVNVVLSPNGITDPAALSGPSFGFNISQFPRRNVRVLGFNLSVSFLSETNLRQAIACIAGQNFFPNSAYYSNGLILAEGEFGYTNAYPYPCAGLDAQARLERAVAQLEGAGYAWDVKPAWDGTARAGSGLRREGTMLPGFTILVVEDDPLRVATASAIVDQLRLLGLEADVEQADAVDVMYRVFDDHRYDMVILGWRLARYPAYLCDLFGPGNPYFYERPELSQHCAAFRSAAELDLASQEALTLQALLAGDVPVVPLYSDVGYDAYAGVTYPFAGMLDGIAGLYGAPSLAMPAP